MESPRSSRPKQKRIILLADDDPDDRTVVQEALNEAFLGDCLETVRNGSECLDFLVRGKRNDGSPAPVPSLILLDLNMPGLDGRKLLKEIKSRPGLRSTPVVILTTSNAVEDIALCYELGVNSYLVKPLSFKEMTARIKHLISYWFEVVELPPVPHEPSHFAVSED